ncbi:MAG: efflux RND transporter periplasmic adaptor subunit [Bacteroidia bacterium]|nr:efflux RND transporter periplasmic adaptor subunit [Bacteroidia bacterium]
MKFKLLIPVVLLALSATSCVEVPEAEFTPYETMIISKTNQELPTAVASNLKGVNTVSVYPKIDAQLKKTLVHNGQHVSMGQVMFKLDDRAQYLALQSATAARLNAEANLSTAKLNYESNKELFQKGIVSDYVLESAENNYKSAQAAVEVAKAEEDVARTNLSYCDITAPVDGVLGEIVPSPGDLVSSTMFKPMTVISDNSEIIANFSLTENDYLAIQNEYGGLSDLNMLPPVDLKLKDGSMYGHKGRITSMSGVVDKQTGSIVCEARFPNPDGKLLSGQNGTIVITFMYEDVIIIPMTAVVLIQDKKLVYKVGADGCATATLIEVAPENTGKNYIVTGGLTVGDEIVASGAVTVQDGMKVK